jgi:ubiquinone/menaquinone biosynthesis C-methylase UbiE
MGIVRWLVYLPLVLVGLLGLFLVLHTILRIVRHIYKFPIPEFAADLIDNPLRRRTQPPDEMPVRHGVLPGMNVLEVGPGNGTYTTAHARAVGDAGHLTTVDIEPKMIDRVNQRIQDENIRNIDARVADVFDLPFEDGVFDLVYMIAVIGEIPTPERALEEFRRVLKPGGIMAFSELLMDPDYPRAQRLERLAAAAGFSPHSQSGNFFSYSLTFKKE